MSTDTLNPAAATFSPEALQAAVVTLADGMRALNRSRLRQDTIILLLHDITKVGKRDIGYVLNALGQLEQHILKPVLKPALKPVTVKR